MLDGDRERYMHWLGEAAREAEVALHAYVLMGNHVHLLMTAASPGALSRTMHRLGTHYVPYFNKRHDRVGVLWERRFHGCLVDTNAYLIACYRYIELNPVRAAMVRAPGEYRWSSYRHNALGACDEFVTPHPVLLAMGLDDGSWRAAYRAIVDAGRPGDEWAEIRREAARNGAFGSAEFRQRVSAEASRDLDRGRGRPRKK
jgi:putative transposase